MGKRKTSSGRIVVPFRPRGGGLPPTGTANPWTAKIIAVYERTRDGFFEIGRLLIQAKRDLPHGEFISMIERELPFGRRYANMLMAVASDRRLGKLATHLPASGACLYEISRLDDATLAAKIRDGIIHPGMSRKDVTWANYRAEAEADARRVAGLVPVRGRHRTLVIDPPWESGGGFGVRYATMSQAELEDPKRLPVQDWLHEDEAHVYLWVTNGEMENAFKLLRLWDVEFQTTITWIKPSFKMGWYFRSQTEHVLFGTRGKLRTRAAARKIPTYFEAPTTKVHSEKPDAFYDIVRAASFPSFGEVFQRASRRGFQNLFVHRRANVA